MSQATTSFDQFADRYDEALGAGLQLTGEGKDYYLRARLKEVARLLSRRGRTTHRVLDFGCGCGDACPVVFEELKATEYVGVDVSAGSLRRAVQQHGSPHSHFYETSAFKPANQFDVAYCNGVFHHIPLAERASAVDFVYHSLQPGGVFAFWENNPWNPGTRLVMRRIPFDRDAITLSPPLAKRLLRQGGFEVVSTTFHFIFPRQLRWLRGMEPVLSRAPLGGQYLVVCRRP